MFEPSDAELQGELMAQSYTLFGNIGLGGVAGPRLEQFNRHRPEGWPQGHWLLKMFGLRRSAVGWDTLLQAFGLMSPTNSEIQEAAQRRNEPDPARPSIPQEDESYLPLTGDLVLESVQETPLGGGWYRRTTTSVIQLR